MNAVFDFFQCLWNYMNSFIPYIPYGIKTFNFVLPMALLLHIDSLSITVLIPYIDKALVPLQLSMISLIPLWFFLCCFAGSFPAVLNV